MSDVFFALTLTNFIVLIVSMTKNDTDWIGAAIAVNVFLIILSSLLKVTGLLNQQ